MTVDSLPLLIAAPLVAVGLLVLALPMGAWMDRHGSRTLFTRGVVAAALLYLAMPLAQKNKVSLRTYNPTKEKLSEQFDYLVLMAPVPALVVQSVKDAAPKAIINIFAGIPANVAAFVVALRAVPGLGDLTPKESQSSAQPFGQP